MAEPDIQTSFSSGELSRNLYSRVDLNQFKSGAALLENWFVDYRGGASTRAGLEFIAECTSDGSPKLFSFQESTTSTYILEIGELYMNIYSGGVFVETLVTPWHEADLSILKYAQSADVMTFTHPAYPPQILRRTSSTTFTIAPMVIGPMQLPPTALVGVPVTGGTAFLAAYTVTAFSPDGKEESLPSNIAYVLTDHNDAAHPIQFTWTPPAGLQPSKYRIYKWGPNVPDHGAGWNELSVFGYIGEAVVPQFTDSGYAPDFTQQPQDFADPFSPGQPTGVTVTTPGGGWAPNSVPTITFSDTTKGHAVLNYNGGIAGVVFDFIGGGNLIPPTVTATGGSGSGAVLTVPSITPLTGTYPSCVTYFQQRQCLAASLNAPQSIWGSQTGAVFNFDQSNVLLDSDSFQIALASRQVNQIKSMVSMPTGMLVFTSSGAWLLSGGGATLGVTPKNISAQPQASSGANDMPPIVVNNNVLIVQSRGSTVRDFVYNFYVNSYFGTDRTVLANQLFFGYTLVDWCYSEEPFRTLNIVRNDGIWLCMTYMPDQQVYAWAHHDTNGLFKSTCSVVEGQEDVIYFIVRRLVQGTWKNYIERQASRNWQGNVEFAWCVDSALQLPQTFPAATLTLSSAVGLVTVTADQAVFDSSQVGSTIRGKFGGKGNVTLYVSPTQVMMLVVSDGLGDMFFPELYDDDNSPQELMPGNWMIAPQVTSASGLDHLKGKTVQALCDGMVASDLVVDNTGTVTFPNSCSFATVGLGFSAKLQTLYIDLDSGPTVQGSRKMLPQVTFRLEDQRGIKVGVTFDKLYEPKYPGYSGKTAVPIPLFSGDQTWPVFAAWTTEGQVCVQQDYPLPCTLLGIIPQIVRGDTGK